MHWPPIEWHHSKQYFSHFGKALYTNNITFLARRNGGRVLLNSLQFPLLPACSEPKDVLYDVHNTIKKLLKMHLGFLEKS